MLIYLAGFLESINVAYTDAAAVSLASFAKLFLQF